MEFLQQRPSTERTVAKFLLQLADVGQAVSEGQLGHLMALGAVHLTVNDLHVVAERDQRKILRLDQEAARSPAPAASAGVPACG